MGTLTHMCVVCAPFTSNPQVVISLSISWTLITNEKTKKHAGLWPSPWHWPPWEGSHGHSYVHWEKSPPDKWQVYCNPYKILFMLLLFLSFCFSLFLFHYFCSPRERVKWLTVGPTARCKPQRDGAKCWERGTTSSTCVCVCEVRLVLFYRACF